jgi:hypothetical protein
LRDVLASRLGDDHVFHDVTTLAADVTGDTLVEPGRTAIGEFGFESDVDPAGASIVLATAGDGFVPFGTG